MSKLMTIYVTTKLVVNCEDMSVTADEIVSDMDYSFEMSAAGAEIVDTEILDYELADS
jgi:hypothetical protein